MKNLDTATIADVEIAFADYKAEAKANPAREGLDAKKLAAAVIALTVKDNVAKDLKQAYTTADRKWASNAMKNAEGCTSKNKMDKVKAYIHESPAYKRHFNDLKSKPKVEKWFAEDFLNLVGEQVEEKAE